MADQSQSGGGARKQPKCIALVICNEIIEDRRTNNKTLVSLFNGIIAPSLPAIHPRMFLMASLTGGKGKWSLSFRLYSPSNQNLLTIEGEESFDDPLGVYDIVIELQGVPLPEEGGYFINLFVENTPIAERRFTVQLAEGA